MTFRRLFLDAKMNNLNPLTCLNILTNSCNHNRQHCLNGIFGRSKHSRGSNFMISYSHLRGCVKIQDQPPTLNKLNSGEREGDTGYTEWNGRRFTALSITCILAQVYSFFFSVHVIIRDNNESASPSPLPSGATAPATGRGYQRYGVCGV